MVSDSDCEAPKEETEEERLAREAKEMAYHITVLNRLIVGCTYIRMNKIARFIKCLLRCIN